MSILSMFLRHHGIRYISENEKREAHRIGAGKAQKLYEPIYERVVVKYEFLENLSTKEKEHYELMKEELIKEFTSLKNQNELLEKRCAAAGFKIAVGGANMMSGLSTIGIRGISVARSIGKDDVPEYQEAIKEGFDKTKKIFEKKLEDMERKIDKLLEDIAGFEIMKDKAFAEAAKRITEEEIRGQYYMQLLESR